MSDEVMNQIKQAMEEQRIKAFEEGWEAGYNALWDSLTDAVRTKAIDRKRPARNDVEEAGDVAEAVVEAAAVENVPRLTAGQQRALAIIRQNPGMKSRELRGIMGQGTLQALVNAGLVTRVNAQHFPAEHG